MIHNHIIEASFLTMAACLAFGGWILASSIEWPPLPREKPEEFVMPPAEYVEPASQTQTTVIRVKPMTDQQRVDQASKDLKEANDEVQQIKRLLKKQKREGAGGS